MKKMTKFTLDFINENIKNNAKSSSYPIRKQQDIKIISPAITPINLNTPNERNY